MKILISLQTCFIFLLLNCSLWASESILSFNFEELDKPLTREEEALLGWPWYEKYEYFQRAQDFKFQAHADSFSLENAYHLAEASILAYSGQENQEKVLSRIGMKYWLFEGKKSGTQGYLAWNSESIWVVFRGTEPMNPMDWITDLNYKLVDSNQGGMVHRGFKAALDEVWTQLHLRLKGLNLFKKRKMWFTGHSLGSALATLAADRIGGDSTVYSFGSPRVGDRNFYRDFQVKCFRFVNNLDIITHVPPHKSFLGHFYHVGDLKQFDKNGKLLDGGVIHETELLKLVGFFDQINKIRFLRMFLDHIPHRYSEKIVGTLEAGAVQADPSDQVRFNP